MRIPSDPDFKTSKINCFVLIALLMAVPILALSQEEKAVEKAQREKARAEAPPGPQASPAAKKPDEAPKPEGQAEEQKPQEGRPRDPMSSPTFSGLRLRSLGPAFTSGRVVGLAVDPNNPAHYFVAAASGGVWKTVNAGTTWTPVFDREGAYSIGCVVLDPKNPLTVWVGTGENNSQRSVSYGNGVYRSDDGGKTWKQILKISENTGVTDIVIDPQDPDTLYAASYQRRRHMWTLIDGGAESAIYKSTDAGGTWNKLRAGLPATEMGRIGLAISPVDPNVVYATIEAADRKGGIFRSQDRGGSWERRNEFDAGAMYYARIVADPKDVERIYVMNVILMITEDSGRSPLRYREK